MLFHVLMMSKGSAAAAIIFDGNPKIAVNTIQSYSSVALGSSFVDSRLLKKYITVVVVVVVVVTLGEKRSDKGSDGRE